jgi:hypothetical protein
MTGLAVGSSAASRLRLVRCEGVGGSNRVGGPLSISAWYLALPRCGVAAMPGSEAIEVVGLAFCGQFGGLLGE